MIACYCHAVSVSQLSNYETLEECINDTNIAQSCETCLDFVQSFYPEGVYETHRKICQS